MYTKLFRILIWKYIIKLKKQNETTCMQKGEEEMSPSVLMFFFRVIFKLMSL